MKQFMNRWLLLFVLLLGMSALACNLPFGGEEEPTAVPTTDDDDDGDSNQDEDVEDAPDEEAETDEVVDEEDEEDEADTAVTEETNDAEPTEESSLFSDLFPESLTVSESVQQFDTLNSYEMSMLFSTTVNTVTQEVEAIMMVSTDPPQTHMTFSFSGFNDMAGISSMSLTQIDGTNYMNMADFGCVTTSETELEDDAFGVMDANDFLTDVGEANLVGEETINGIETLHYVFDESVIGEEMAQFNWAQGDVYVAKEGNYVVRFVMEGEGVVEGFGLSEDENGATPGPQIGMIHVEMNLTSINEPVTITIPEACENSGLADSDFPVLDDASEATSFGGIVTYKTETSFADAVAFYQDSLAADGWVYDEDASFILENSTALLYFSKDGRSLSIAITEETGTDAFNVVIFEE